ncbi:MAG: hypothetical protein ACOC56_02570 [Atribacterota bacterium]
MPRKLPDEEIDDDEEEELEEFEEEEKEKPKFAKKSKIPKNKIMKKNKRRFAVYAPSPLRIADVESNEIIGEGEYVILQVLTDILERLERIENNLGSMID